MTQTAVPGLSLAIARLATAGPESFAIWVVQAPLPGGYVHRDCAWTPELTRKWLAWQQVFSYRELPHLPVAHALDLTPATDLPVTETNDLSYSGRLMQDFGISLWAWLFQDVVRNSLAQSRGLAIGQNHPLRLRLDIRDPNLIPLPWETIQPEAGKQAIALNQQLLFSRTTSDVDPLAASYTRDRLQILLVVGENSEGGARPKLQLEQEAATLARVIEQQQSTDTDPGRSVYAVPAAVDTLLQPTTAELIAALETGKYNVFFYAGHGEPAPDGGRLFLQPGATINGTELAQVLVRARVALATFNACWGAQPETIGAMAIPRSSLAEVLVHHGVPAVLAMRDTIADAEALSFIHSFLSALSERLPVDRAVAIARQQLLTLYKFNQPAWTLPILYMHPEFDGMLVQSLGEGVTQLPTYMSAQSYPTACLRSLAAGDRVWQLQGLVRIGRHPESDVPIREKWVSQKHAEIFCREPLADSNELPAYFLRDFSRYGTLLADAGNAWRKVHHQEIRLQSGSRLKFGSAQGQIFEFACE
ncbi:MAG: CHAT domain-containing protein [Myxococcales bacterium]|nr:CHAT domain-containing protein [Myxococcales bacterium]